MIIPIFLFISFIWSYDDDCGAYDTICISSNISSLYGAVIDENIRKIILKEDVTLYNDLVIGCTNINQITIIGDRKIIGDDDYKIIVSPECNNSNPTVVIIGDRNQGNLGVQSKIVIENFNDGGVVISGVVFEFSWDVTTFVVNEGENFRNVILEGVAMHIDENVERLTLYEETQTAFQGNKELSESQTMTTIEGVVASGNFAETTEVIISSNKILTLRDINLPKAIIKMEGQYLKVINSNLDEIKMDLDDTILPNETTCSLLVSFSSLEHLSLESRGLSHKINITDSDFHTNTSLYSNSIELILDGNKRDNYFSETKILNNKFECYNEEQGSMEGSIIYSVMPDKIDRVITEKMVFEIVGNAINTNGYGFINLEKGKNESNCWVPKIVISNNHFFGNETNQAFYVSCGEGVSNVFIENNKISMYHQNNNDNYDFVVDCPQEFGNHLFQNNSIEGINRFSFTQGKFDIKFNIIERMSYFYMTSYHEGCYIGENKFKFNDVGIVSNQNSLLQVDNRNTFEDEEQKAIQIFNNYFFSNFQKLGDYYNSYLEISQNSKLYNLYISNNLFMPGKSIKSLIFLENTVNTVRFLNNIISRGDVTDFVLFNSNKKKCQADSSDCIVGYNLYENHTSAIYNDDFFEEKPFIIESDGIIPIHTFNEAGVSAEEFYTLSKEFSVPYEEEITPSIDYQGVERDYKRKDYYISIGPLEKECTGNFGGENCDECYGDFIIGELCDSCNNSLILVDNACICENKEMSPYSLPDSCTECLNGYGFDPNNCSKCREEFTGEGCNECVYNFDGEFCDSCSENFTGLNCSSCVTGKDGELCNECDIGYEGENCSKCSNGYKERDCEKEEECLTACISQNSNNVGILVGAIIGIPAFLGCILLIILLLVIFLVVQKKKIKKKYEVEEELKDDGTSQRKENCGSMKVDDKIEEVLKELALDSYIENFRKAKVIFNDIELMKDSDLEKLIPDEFPRRRFKKRVLEGVNSIATLTKSQEENEMEFFDGVDKKLQIEKNLISISKTINSGSFGIVRAGEMKVGTSSVSVAVKEIPIGKGASIKEIIREVEIMVSLQHENVLKCFGCYVDRGSISIVMELCKTDIFDFKKKKIPKKIRVKLLHQIAAGMEYLHSFDIIHRDLKTQNVLLSENNLAKLCDFGTSKHVQSVQQTFCGTVEYLSSEQYDVSLASDPKLVDVYSFGIIIWEVWSGETPYKELKDKLNGNQFEMLNQIHQNNIRPDLKKCSNMPEDLKELMISCWSKNPEDRPSDFSEICEVLSEVEKIVK